MILRFKDLKVLNEILDPKIQEINQFVYELNFATPFELLLIASLIKEREIDIHDYKYEECCYRSMMYAKYMNFFKVIGKDYKETEKHNDRYYPITMVDLKNYIRIRGNIVEGLSDNIVMIINDDDSLSSILRYAISEILRNVPEHSNNNNAWICAQNWYHNSYKEVEIAIVDYGVGIINNLRKIYPNLGKDELIKKAISPGITTSDYKIKSYESDEYMNSGYGLYVVCKICEELCGEFVIISDQIVYSNNKSKCLRLDYPFEGTAIKIRMKVDNQSNYKNLIKKIVSEGEEVSYSDINAINYASKRSRVIYDD